MRPARHILALDVQLTWLVVGLLAVLQGTMKLIDILTKLIEILSVRGATQLLDCTGPTAGKASAI